MSSTPVEAFLQALEKQCFHSNNYQLYSRYESCCEKSFLGKPLRKWDSKVVNFVSLLQLLQQTDGQSFTNNLKLLQSPPYEPRKSKKEELQQLLDENSRLMAEIVSNQSKIKKLVDTLPESQQPYYQSSSSSYHSNSSYYPHSSSSSYHPPTSYYHSPPPRTVDLQRTKIDISHPLDQPLVKGQQVTISISTFDHSSSPIAIPISIFCNNSELISNSNSSHLSHSFSFSTIGKYQLSIQIQQQQFKTWEWNCILPNATVQNLKLISNIPTPLPMNHPFVIQYQLCQDNGEECVSDQLFSIGSLFEVEMQIAFIKQTLHFPFVKCDKNCYEAIIDLQSFMEEAGSICHLKIVYGINILYNASNVELSKTLQLNQKKNNNNSICILMDGEQSKALEMALEHYCTSKGISISLFPYSEELFFQMKQQSVIYLLVERPSLSPQYMELQMMMQSIPCETKLHVTLLNSDNVNQIKNYFTPTQLQEYSNTCHFIECKRIQQLDQQFKQEQEKEMEKIIKRFQHRE